MMSFMCVQTPSQVKRVYENHFYQLNRCSVRGLKEEVTPETQYFFGGNNIKGQKNIFEAIEGTCKESTEGGIRGINFKEEAVFIVGNVANIKWVATAPFLEEPYPGSDAYVTCGNKMLAMVSSFDASELKFKKGLGPKK